MTVRIDSTDNITVLKDIPVKLDASRILERLRMHNKPERIDDIIAELIAVVSPVASPKAIYKTSHARTINRKTMEIDGIELTSYVPTLNFSDGETVFPYVATCGTEVDAIKFDTGDFMKRYCLNLIKEMLLRSASEFLREHLMNEYKPAELTHVGPGEALGPVAQQRELFSILGNVENSIGVRLSPHNMMVPEKSSSGVFFETDIKLESCQLCPDARCVARRHKYEPELLKKYRSKSSKNQA